MRAERSTLEPRCGRKLRDGFARADRQFGEFLTVPRADGQALAMSTEMLPPKKKLPIAKLAIGAGIALVVAAVIVWLVGWERALAEGTRLFHAGMDLVSSAGPGVYFACMAILPIIGIPTSPFAVGAGPLFGEQLGMPLVILCGELALTINMALAYWLARRWLRPFLSQKLANMGYALPQAEGGNATDLIILLRVTPGPPFFVQNYLLGLANVPFGRYMVISCAAQWLFNLAFMLFGDALSQGRGKLALYSLMGFAALVAMANVVRKRLSQKKAAAPAS